MWHQSGGCRIKTKPKKKAVGVTKREMKTGGREGESVRKKLMLCVAGYGG